MNTRTYLDWMRLGPFIESLEWVYLLGATSIMGGVWTQQEEWSEFWGIHPTIRDVGQWVNHLRLQKTLRDLLSVYQSSILEYGMDNRTFFRQLDPCWMTSDLLISSRFTFVVHISFFFFSEGCFGHFQLWTTNMDEELII